MRLVTVIYSCILRGLNGLCSENAYKYYKMKKPLTYFYFIDVIAFTMKITLQYAFSLFKSLQNTDYSS